MFKSIGSDKFAFAGYNQKLRVPLHRDKDGVMLEKPIKDLNRGNKATTALTANLTLLRTIHLKQWSLQKASTHLAIWN